MSTSEGEVIAFSSKVVDKTIRSFAKRWKHQELFANGFVAVPTLFLHHYAHLKPHPLSPGEVLFVIHLMEFKWGEDAPFPGYATIAQRMGISDKMARRHAQSLQAKQYLHRKMRRGQTNQFDLTPLFDVLLKAVLEARQRPTPSKPTRKAKQEYMENMFDWFGRMVEASFNMPKEDQKAVQEWEAANLDKGVATSDWPGWEKYIGKKPE